MRRLSWSQWAGLFLAVEGGAVSAGWLLRVPIWAYVLPSATSMVFSTALCLGLAGLALLLPGTTLPRDSQLPNRVGSCIGLIGLAALLENSFSISLGIDLGWLHQWFTDQNPHPGRMAPNTALALMTAGITLTLKNPARMDMRHSLAGALAAVVLTLGILGLIAYTLLLELAYSWWGFPRMAFATAIGIIVLGAGLLAEVHKVANRTAQPGSYKLYAFLGMAVTVLITVMLVSYGSINALLERARWVEHTDRVRAEFETLMSSYNRMHIAWRDFLAAGGESSLEEFDSVSHNLNKQLLNVVSLVSDNQQQVARLEEMGHILDEDIQSLQRGAALKRAGQIDRRDDTAVQLVGANFNRLRIGHLADQIREEETRLLQGRQKDSQDTSNSMVIVILTGNAIGFAILLYSLWELKRQNEARDVLEKSLQTANQEYLDLYNKAPCGYHSTDKNGVIQRMNDTLLSWLGYTREEVVGKMRFSDLHTKDSLQRTQEHLQTFIRDGKIRDIEYEFVRKDGSTLPVLLNAVAVYDEAGTYLKSRSTVYDITKRKQMESELHRSNAFLDSLIDNIPDIIVVKEATELRYVRVNKAAQQMLGYSQDELAGKTAADIVKTEQAERANLTDRAVLEGRVPVVIPDSPIRFNQKEFIFHTVKFPILGPDGKPQYLLSIARDVTAHKQAEEAIRELNASLQVRAAQLEATNKELESFSYSVSHDLRAPLRAIDGYALMIEEDYGTLLDAEGTRYLAQVREHSRRMGTLIDDLLHFSRLGRQAINRREIDMGQLVREVLDELSQDEGPPRATIEIAALPSARADRALLRQVWINLISNALKYSGKTESPEVRIDGHHSNGEAVYSVRDNGAGFDMAYYDKLFGVFQRLHRADEFAGTGVGLAIVHRAIIRHGGRVWAEGEVGRGACFYFTLPMGEVDD